MVMMTHNVNYVTHGWRREISIDGKELLYDATWQYEPINKSNKEHLLAQVELYDDSSSFEL